MIETKKDSLFSRFWRSAVEASEVFVALRYGAPWERSRSTCN